MHIFIIDLLIKELTGHQLIEALHKYKHTGAAQQKKFSMALNVSDDDDFKPVKKKPKLRKENVSDDDDDVPVKKKPTNPSTNPEDYIWSINHY